MTPVHMSTWHKSTSEFDSPDCSKSSLYLSTRVNEQVLRLLCLSPAHILTQ